MKFKNACDRFYYNQLVIGNQKATVNAYKSHLKPFELFCKNCDVSKITYKMYCDYIVYLTENKKLSSVTRYDYAKDLKIVLAYFYKNRFIKNNIAAKIEKLPKRKYMIPKIISSNVIRKILNDCNKNNSLHVRNALIICLAYDCGLRLSELVRLKVNDFDFDNGVIRVTGKWNKQRNVPLTATVSEYYKHYIKFFRLKKYGQLLVTKENRPITQSCIKILFKRLKKKYNLQDFHPHLLRHSFATLFLLNGGDALVLQEILGHTTLEMTKNYVHIANSISIAKNNVYSPLTSNIVATQKAFRQGSLGKPSKDFASTRY